MLKKRHFVHFFLFKYIFLILCCFTVLWPEFPQDEKTDPFALSLIGVVVSKDASSSLAIIKEEGSGQILLLQKGESVFGLKLVQVEENGVVLENEGIRHQILIGKRLNFKGELGEKQNENKSPTQNLIKTAEKGAPNDSLINNPIMDEGLDFRKIELVKSDIKNKIQLEWPLIMKEIRFIPHTLNGRTRGFKIISLPKTGILSEIGIRENDVIRKINGVELNDLSTLFHLYSEIKNENECEVIIEREGKPLRLLFILR